MKIVLDPHAVFQIARRGIPVELVEATVNKPDKVENREDGKISFLKCFPEKGKMLRVVARADDHRYVITAYFDRRQPCV